MGLLTILLLIPILGAILILALPASRDTLARPVAIIASSLTLMFSWFLLTRFDTTQAGLQFLERYVWNSRLGTSYALGVDGFSFPMLLLATLLCLVAILASANIRQRPKGYYFSMLLLEAAMLGVFMAQDWALFYVFWEFTLIPLFFLIDRWGGVRRSMASLNFVLYTMGGSVFMLISLLTVFDAVGMHSFDMQTIQEGAQGLPQATQVLIFLGLLIGFGVKMPIFPLHGWLPLAHVEAPSPVSILLSGILLKMGSYGLLRAAGMLPQAVLSLQSLLAGLALFSLIYGGLLAWRQSDLKRMIAYSSISHMGVVLLGIAALNVAGLTGAVMQMVAHGLVAGALFLLIGLLYERTKTRDIHDYASLISVTPRFAFFIIIAFVGAVGLPGTAGFVAELHAIIGGFARWGWVIILISLGVLISAAYAVRTISLLFTGPSNDKMQQIKDLQKHELPAAAVLCFAIIALGLYPEPLLKLSAASVSALSQLF
ncbi:complex I subunit 4 family protein [Candidatus Venteria ishoeyi]|uniref:NADH-quinone oxidoreductase subunit M n=1 Tax=Candidatus Venteria ishoeyi TaxID=1899563 RepID=A0A1H6F597_9GAMM|nr:NADH-quinone oxidoreductase subunit M [Candidatus Venteria ishoeyi]MDM8545647.1 NADH-quinone oxidoreductase subunit M [Candidatus Venteria ishoeyi]SEH04561.1 NAD(P)H-quinone oxidoreductase chain 4 1 [Candidatus Venteria ishoeyi]